MASEYICGPLLTANDSEDALSQIMPLHNFALEIVFSENIVCAPRYGATFIEITIMIIITMVSSTILGYTLNKNSKLK